MKKQPEKFDIDLNMDIATKETIDATNKKLVKYLDDTGEDSASKQVKYLIKNQDTNEKIIGTKNPVYGKLLITNNKILEVLQKIYNDMYDEQDTSIIGRVTSPEKITNVPQRVETKQQISQQIQQPEENNGLNIPFLPRLPKFNFFRRGKDATKAGKAATSAIRAEKQAASGVTKASSKIAAKEAGVALKATSGLTKGAGKLLRLAKGAGPLGLAITTALTVYDAYSGWNEAGENLGIDKDKLTTTNKASSAAGSVVSGLTFGLVNKENVSKGINNFFGGNEIIKTYETAGIISHHTIGNSEVLDWAKLEALPAQEIQNIISIDDWKKEDLERMVALRDGAAQRTGNIPPVQQANPGEVKQSEQAAASKQVAPPPKPQRTKQAAKEVAATAATAAASNNINEKTDEQKEAEEANKEIRKQQVENAKTNISSINSNIENQKKMLANAEAKGDTETANKIKNNIDNLEKQKNIQEGYITEETKRNNEEKIINEKAKKSENKKGSGVKKQEKVKKTSEVKQQEEQKEIAKTEKKEKENETVETSKTPKEKTVDDSNKNLTKQVQTAEVKKAETVANVIAPSLQQNINNSEQPPVQVPGKDRILNLFS